MSNPPVSAPVEINIESSAALTAALVPMKLIEVMFGPKV